MISGLRKRAGQFVLGRNLRQNKRGVRPISLAEVQSVLILVDIDKKEDFKAALEYERYLKKEEGVRQVDIFGYTDKKELPEDLIAMANQFFLCRKDLNWLYLPTSKDVVKLFKSKHQLLIDTSFEESFPINFALAVSNATFKVGPKSKHHEQHLDFMIDMKDRPNVQMFFAQLNHFLNMFNRIQ